MTKDEEKIALFGYFKQDFESKDPWDRYKMDLYQWGLTGNSRAIESFRKEKNDIIYSLSTAQGQSGAPIVLVKKNGAMKIIGVHKGLILMDRKTNQGQFNSGRNLTPQLIKELRTETIKLGALPFWKDSPEE